MFTNSFAGDNFWPASIALDVSQLDMGSDDEWASIDIYSKLDPAPGGLINDFIIQDAKIAVESDFPNKAPPKEVPHEFQPAVEKNPQRRKKTKNKQQIPPLPLPLPPSPRINYYILVVTHSLETHACFGPRARC